MGFCHLVKLTALLTLLACSSTTASPSVTSFEPRHNRTIPATLAENVTFVCTVDSSTPVWEVGHSQNVSSQLPLTGIQLHNRISHYKQRGIITEDNTSQNLSKLIITKVARQRFPLLQVRCIVLNTNCSSGFYYVVTNDEADDILCPGQRMSYSCSASTAIHWMGSAFDQLCPSANNITLLAANSTVGDTLGCGVLDATITSVTGLNISSNLTFTATSTLPMDRSHIICRDANLLIVEAYAINIQAPPPAPNITNVGFAVGESFSVEWSGESAEVVDGIDFYIVPDELNCTRDSVTISTCQYSTAHLGQAYNFTVLTHNNTPNCGTQESEATVTVNLQVPLVPTFTHITTVYNNSELIRITSQINITAPVDIAEGFVDGSVISHTFTYNDGSGSPPTFDVPSANCSGGVCQHVFTTPTSSVPSFYNVSATATNVVGEGPATTSQTIYTKNSTLQAVILSSNTVFCLHDEQPASNCSIHYGANPSNLLNTDTAIADGVIMLTSNLTGDTTFYMMFTTIGSLTVKLYGSFNICSIQDLMVLRVTFLAQSSCGEPSGDGPIACYNGVTPGSTVVYHCANSSIVSPSGQSTRMCQSNGMWSGTTPSCVCNVSLAVPPAVENAEVSVAVSADSRRAIATYSTGGIYSILGNSTLVFDCDSGWTPALPQVTVAGWFVPSLVILTAVLTLILVVVIAIIMKRILVRRRSGQRYITEDSGQAHVYDEVGPGLLSSAEKSMEMKKTNTKHYSPKSHGPVYEDVAPIMSTNAHQILKTTENIAYDSKRVAILENPTYKSAEHYIQTNLI